MFEVVEPPYDADVALGVPHDPDHVGMCLSPIESLEAAQALADIERSHHADELAELGAEGILARAEAGQRQVNLIQAEQLALAAQWADVNSTLSCPTFVPGSETMRQLGGDGTPEVAEFAAAELGAALRVSTGSAGFLMADALDLRHRLPRLWSRVQAGDVKIWVARRIAARTRRLDEAGAAKVDGSIAPLAAAVPYGRLEKALDAAILRADPQQADDDMQAVADSRGVWVGRDVDHGHRTVFGRADAPDLTALDSSLDALARAMTVLGDTDTHDVRRAKALGLFADPEAALRLTRLANETHPASSAVAPAGDGQFGHDGTAPRRRCDLGRAILYVHITGDSLTDGGGSGAAGLGAGVARVEDVGAVLMRQVAQWLGHRHVTVKPILDVAGLPAVDCYEVPDRIAEAIRLRTPADCFVYSSNVGRAGDNEHTMPFVPKARGGPPGQTAVDKLGRMTRPTHRIKTHGRWKVTQPRSGAWIWRSPHGMYFLVDHAGTTALGSLWSRAS